jgi:hypothetical protein
MEFIEFKHLDDVLSTNYKYNLFDNYVAVQISNCKIYAIFSLNPKYRRVVVEKFLEQPIYICELINFINSNKYKSEASDKEQSSNQYRSEPDFITLVNTINNSKNIITYRQIIPDYLSSYYTNMSNKLLIISFI